MMSKLTWAILLGTTAMAASPLLFRLKRHDQGGGVSTMQEEKGKVTLANRLSESASPYLKSAAHQPVAWQPWGQEAFELAKQLDRPILLDIGAVWCHWCHVMDRESYENAEVATLINEMFVPVKVDRDERPDVDQRYQRAVGAITGGGGWPLTAFLTPDGEVFFGGTYFPPEDRGGRAGLKTVLPQVYHTYKERKADVLASARQLTEHLSRTESVGLQSGEVSPPLVKAIAESTAQEFDADYGGFGVGQGPKFPHPSAVELALMQHFKTHDAHWLIIATKTLDAMAAGGIHDHVGGGFHRYSVDRYWHVPHFEKMAYDNAPLLVNYLHAYQVTGAERYKDVAEGILRWVTHVLSDRKRGGFYAHQDADVSLAGQGLDDGSYFTWTKREIDEALSGKEREVFIRYFGITDEPHDLHTIPDRNVLYAKRTKEGLAKELGIAIEEVATRLETAYKRLREVRTSRPMPFVEKTLFANYNGMFISAFLEAYKVLGRQDARDFAIQSLEFLLKHLYRPGQGFHHAFSDGRARVEGLLDDQALMAKALLDAYEVTGEEKYLDIAKDVMEFTLAQFWDEKDGGFLDKRKDSNEAVALLSLERKPFQDSPTPSPNAVAAMVLDRLYYLTNEARYRDRAEETLRVFAGVAPAYGTFAATYALAVDYHVDPPAHVVILGKATDVGTRALLKSAYKVYRPEKIVVVYDPKAVDLKKIPPVAAPILQAHLTGEGPIAFVCAGTVCAPPTEKPQELEQLLRSVAVPTP